MLLKDISTIHNPPPTSDEVFVEAEDNDCWVVNSTFLFTARPKSGELHSSKWLAYFQSLPIHSDTTPNAENHVTRERVHIDPAEPNDLLAVSTHLTRSTE